MKKILIILLFFIGLAVGFSQPPIKKSNKVELNYLNQKAYYKGKLLEANLAIDPTHHYVLFADGTWINIHKQK